LAAARASASAAASLHRPTHKQVAQAGRGCGSLAFDDHNTESERVERVAADALRVAAATLHNVCYATRARGMREISRALAGVRIANIM